ncbi:MAG: hypothetical protein M3P96_05960 [Actinomycetota bacterium]|nr:hypothetical protein [Actinomycetota bacterium]
MDLRIGYRERGPLALDTDVPSRADTTNPDAAHAVAAGSVVALCGAPVAVGEDPWPPPPEAVCPLCQRTVQGYVR